MKYLFDKHVLPGLGQYSPRKITLTPLQLLVNKMAEDGYSKSAVKHIRTYLKACFEYAIDEDLIPKNPRPVKSPSFGPACDIRTRRCSRKHHIRSLPRVVIDQTPLMSGPGVVLRD